MTTADMQANGLGKWCSFEEATHSDTAIAHKLANVPTAAQWTNMLALYETIYVPLCEHYLHRLHISSFFRSPAVNTLVGGSSSSAHMLGQAMDIDCDGLSFLSNLELLTYIRQHFVFDQLILEYPDANGNPRWVHVSYRLNGKNRGQVLKARYEYRTVKGKTVKKTVYDVI